MIMVRQSPPRSGPSTPTRWPALARCPPCSSGTRISQTWLCCVAKPTRPSGTSSVPRRRSMPALRDLQSAFLRAMLGPDEPQLLEAIVGDGLLHTARLQMYRHHVLTSLTEVLQVTFPVICRLVDERFFRYAADAYIRQSPPEAPCLFEYGAHFAAFLAAFPPCRALVYLADVARLEWALNVALHAEVRMPLDPTELGGLAPYDMAQLTFQFDPSVTLLD